MKTISKILAIVVALTVLIAAFLAYFVRSVEVDNGLVYDGLGRLLSESPVWASIFLTSEYSWAGLGWHVLDIVWFFGGLFIAYKLYEWSE